MPVRLLVKSKAETGAKAPEELLLSADSITLGRDKSCAVVLNDQTVSRNHAQLVREGALYFLEDLGSSFGTRVNGASLPPGEKRLLRNGDVLAIGPYDVTFDRVADVEAGATDEKTSFVAKRVVKDALRNLASGAGPFLRVMNGPMEGRKIEIHDAQEIVIGRDESAEVRLEGDDLVSRRHAKIRRDWTGTTLEDLDSRNGVYVNKKKIGTHALKDRDELEVGGTRFLYLDPSEVRETPLVPEEKPKPPGPKTSDRVRADAGLKSSDRVKVNLPPEPEEKEEAKEKPAPPVEEPEEEAESEEEEGGEEPAEEDEEGLGDGAPEGTQVDPSGPKALDADPDFERPAGGRGARAADILTADGLRRMIPVFVAGGIALLALGVLAVTFFVM